MEFKWVGIMFIGIFLAGALQGFAPSEKEKAKQARWNECVTTLNQAIPDPNDTEARVEFLKECYD